MAESLPIHMSDDEEEIIDNESDISELSNNDEETEYDSASEMSLDSDFNEDDDVFQAPLVVPQQQLIPYSSLVYVLIYFIVVVIKWDEVFVLLHYNQSLQTSSITAFVPWKDKPQ